MRRIHLGRIFQTWLDNGNRFPFASFLAHFGALCAVSLVVWEYGDPLYNPVASMMMACMVIFPLAILAQAVFAHHRSRNLMAHAFLIALGVGLAFLFYRRTGQVSDWHVWSFLLLAAASHLLYSSVAYIADRDNYNFWEFNRQSLANLFVGLLYGCALWLVGSAALFAVDHLFELNFSERVYAIWSIVSLVLLSTGYFIAQFPADFQFSKEEMVFDRAYLVLTKYLFIPVTLLYFVILYAYGIKIAVNWSLPKGWVAGLCIAFSLAGIITWLLNYFLPNSHEGALLGWFKRWFWVLTIPVIALLFVAIGKRISDYGITEERYLVAMIAGCFLVNMLYYALVPKHRQRLWFLPITVAVAAIISAYGPLNARDVAIRNQKKLLVRMLTDAGLYENGAIRVPEKEVKVPSILLDKCDFLASRDSAALYQVLQLDSTTRQQIHREFGGISGYALSQKLKLSPIYSNTELNIPQIQNYLSNFAYQLAYPVPTGAKFKLKPPYDNMDFSAPENTKGYQLEVVDSYTKMYLRENGLRIDSFSMKPVEQLLSEMIVKNAQGIYGDTLATLFLQGSKYRLACIPDMLNGEKSGAQYRLTYIGGDYYLIME